MILQCQHVHTEDWILKLLNRPYALLNVGKPQIFFIPSTETWPRENLLYHNQGLSQKIIKTNPGLKRVECKKRKLTLPQPGAFPKILKTNLGLKRVQCKKRKLTLPQPRQ